MPPSKIILWSAVTTIIGTVLATKFRVKVPGFER